MTSETKAYIEQHIDQIENNGLSFAYLNCPLRILNEFNNILHYAGICYPPEIHIYVVLCCYITTHFTNTLLRDYDFDYTTGKEAYEFISDNSSYVVEQLNHDLSILFPQRKVNADIAQQRDFIGMPVLKIRVEVD